MNREDLRYAPLTHEHLDQVMVIEEECFPSPWPRKAFEEELALTGASFFLVALAGEAVVGYGGYRFGAGEIHITNLAVSKHEQRRGVGRKLTELLIDRGREQGAAQAHLEVRRSNLAAQELYRSLGFEVTGTRPGYYQREKEDAILMRMEL